MTRTRTIENDDDDGDDASDKGGGDQTGDVPDAMRWTRGDASDGHQTWIV